MNEQVRCDNKDNCNGRSFFNHVILLIVTHAELAAERLSLYTHLLH